LTTGKRNPAPPADFFTRLRPGIPGPAGGFIFSKNYTQPIRGGFWWFFLSGYVLFDAFVF
jgi:hypothetical protein